MTQKTDSEQLLRKTVKIYGAKREPDTFGGHVKYFMSEAVKQFKVHQVLI